MTVVVIFTTSFLLLSFGLSFILLFEIWKNWVREDIHTSSRTVHGPAVERDAAGRRESGRYGRSLAASGCSSTYAAAVAVGAGRNIRWSEASRLGLRPEFGTQLEADERVAWKAERHLQWQPSSGTVISQHVLNHFDCNTQKQKPRQLDISSIRSSTSMSTTFVLTLANYY